MPPANAKHNTRTGAAWAYRFLLAMLRQMKAVALAGARFFDRHPFFSSVVIIIVFHIVTNILLLLHGIDPYNPD